MSALNSIRTDELTVGARVIWDKDWTSFTVDSVTPAKLDWRFQGRQSDGSYSSESGMDVVGHDAKGERVQYLAAQSYLWWIDAAAEEPTAAAVTSQSAPTTHDPLVVNTQDGVVWQRRALTREGRGLYAVADAPACCPEYVMASLPELAEHGIAGSADVLPVPAGTEAAVAESADKLTRLLAPTQALREDTAVCRCDEPGVDPYSCEADDCTATFSELNPFGGTRPVDEPSAEVSRKCQCGWHSSVWHVDDGSAEAELYEHVTTMHGTEGGAS